MIMRESEYCILRVRKKCTVCKMINNYKNYLIKKKWEFAYAKMTSLINCRIKWHQKKKKNITYKDRKKSKRGRK